MADSHTVHRLITGLSLALAMSYLVLAVGGCAPENGEPAPDSERPTANDIDRDVTPPSADRNDTPTTLDEELQRMAIMIQQGRTQAARDSLEQYTLAHPSHGPATFLLGLSYHQEFRYAKALPHFERAAELSPDYHPIYHFLGWCRYHLGDADGAREAMKTHLEHSPEEGDSHYVIGLVDMEAGHDDEAEDRFRKAVEYQRGVPGREGSLANAHAQLGRILYQRSEWDEAREQLETAVQLNPMHDEAWYKLYRLFLRIGDEEKAELARERHEQVSRQLQRETGFPE